MLPCPRSVVSFCGHVAFRHWSPSWIIATVAVFFFKLKQGQLIKLSAPGRLLRNWYFTDLEGPDISQDFPVSNYQILKNIGEKHPFQPCQGGSRKNLVCCYFVDFIGGLSETSPSKAPFLPMAGLPPMPPSSTRPRWNEAWLRPATRLPFFVESCPTKTWAKVGQHNRNHSRCRKKVVIKQFWPRSNRIWNVMPRVISCDPVSINKTEPMEAINILCHGTLNRSTNMQASFHDKNS